MPRTILSLLTFVLAVTAAFGQGANVTLTAAGTLKSAVADPTEVSSLTVAGPMDAADFYFIAREMPALKALDLADVTVEQYKGASIDGRTQFDAGIIPSGVFAGTQIESLTLPTAAGIVIGNGAFAAAPLKSLTIGPNIAKVGDAAFSLCPDLAEVTVAAPQIGAGAFADCAKLAKVTFTAPAALDHSAFARDAALAEVKGSGMLTSIGSKAFLGCTSLADFNFGQSLATVGERAFSLSSLKSADLSQCAAGLKVGDWAFAEMPALTAADLSAAASLGDGVVFNNPVLASYTAPATDSIPVYAYALSASLAGDGLIAEGVRVVGAHALQGLATVTDITVPASVEYIGDAAMSGMTALTDITTEATEVPSLGRDVWKGVEQGSVTLTVPEGYGPEYAAADQWKEFNIYDVASIDDITSEGDSSEPLAELKARFIGPELQVSIGGDIEITRLALHDVSGILLLAVEPFENLVTIDTSDLQGRIFILAATLSDGRSASLKLAR